MPADPPETRRLAVPAGVASDDLCLNGHFPGDPVVPGAVLLAEAVGWLFDEGLEVTHLRRVKFLSPLLPDVAYEIRASEGPRGLTLRWIAGDRLLAEGIAEIAPGDG